MAKHIKPILSILTTGVALHAFCTPSRFFFLEGFTTDNPELDQVQYEEIKRHDNYKINNVENLYKDSESMQDLKKFLNLKYLPELKEKPDQLLRYFHNKLGSNNQAGIKKMKRWARNQKPDMRTKNGRIRDGRIRLLKHSF